VSKLSQTQAGQAVDIFDLVESWRRKRANFLMQWVDNNVLNDLRAHGEEHAWARESQLCEDVIERRAFLAIWLFLGIIIKSHEYTAGFWQGNGLSNTEVLNLFWSIRWPTFNECEGGLWGRYLQNCQKLQRLLLYLDNWKAVNFSVLPCYDTICDCYDSWNRETMVSDLQSYKLLSNLAPFSAKATAWISSAEISM